MPPIENHPLLRTCRKGSTRELDALVMPHHRHLTHQPTLEALNLHTNMTGTVVTRFNSALTRASLRLEAPGGHVTNVPYTPSPPLSEEDYLAYGLWGLRVVGLSGGPQHG